MNIRDLINRIESIELNEGLRLKDIEAQVAKEPNEQKRAQTLMTLAQTNKLPGLYDPVSGYFVSAEPDTQGEWQGAGTPTKPRISSTGTEDQDALLAKRGLVPAKANTSTFLRHLNPFSSSNKDYDAGVQGGSQAAIARQNKEDDELKQLTDLIPKYKALKDKLASLNGANTDARTGHGIVPADKPLAEALMESFRGELFENENFDIPEPPNNIIQTPEKEVTKSTVIVGNPFDSNGEPIYDMDDLIFDLKLTALFVGVGTLIAPATAGASEAAAIAAVTPRLVRIGKALANAGKNAANKFKSAEEFKNALSTAAKKYGPDLQQTIKWNLGINTAVRADQAAGTGITDKIGQVYTAGKHAIGLNESIASLRNRLQSIEEAGPLATGASDIAGQLINKAEKNLVVPPYKPNWTFGSSGFKPTVSYSPEFQQLLHASGPEVEQVIDMAGAAEKETLRKLSIEKAKAVIEWIKANRGKSLAAALTASAVISNVGGGRGHVNPPNAIPGDPRTTSPEPEPTPKSPSATTSNSSAIDGDYTVKQGDTLSRIARRMDVTLPELLAANPALADEKHRGGNLIHPGEVVKKPGATDETPDNSKDAEEAKKAEEVKKAEIESTQKEIDTAKKQLADLIVDLEKSEDEDNVKQLKDLEAQLDDLEDIKSLNSNNPGAGNYTNQMDQASDAASAKKAQANDPSSANYTNQMDRSSDAASAKVKESYEKELDRWLKIANIK
jgi:LysM repeat protein